MVSSYRTPSDIHPCLTYRDAPAALDWLCRVLGFTRQLVVEGPGGAVVHSELSFGTGVVMVSSPKPEIGRLAPGPDGQNRIQLSVFVPEVDVHYQRAVDSGAKITSPIKEEEYGARGFGLEDLEGHQWYFSNYRPGEYWTNPPDT